MSELPDPLVTFALFAFNQEKYVRAAIEGAFAQDFAPMEIILSDDGSSDRTFAIMQEMATAYRGPHQVRVRRQATNAGTVQHVINVAREARGDLMVVNAGDDISNPERARLLHEAWIETGAAALSSFHDEIDADGKMLRQGVSFPPSAVAQWLFANEHQAHRIDDIIQTIPGFCAAYPRNFWADVPDPPVRLLVEDGLAAALIIFRGGKIVRVPKSLIAYRLLDDSMTDRSVGLTADAIVQREAKIDRAAQESIRQIDFILDQARREGIAVHPRTLAALAKGRVQNELLAHFWQDRATERVSRMIRARSAVDVKFLLPRIFGFRAFTKFRIAIEKRRHATRADRDRASA